RLGLAALAEWEAQQFELLRRGGEQEIALVALFLTRAVKRAAALGEPPRGDVMTGCQNLGIQFARGDQQIMKLDRHIAIDARHRRFAMDIALGKTVDHRFLEATLVVEHIMRDADALGDAARVVDVLARAAGALAMGGRAMVVELQRHADYVVALGFEQRRGDRGIDATGHGDDDAGVLRAAGKVEAVGHAAPYYKWRACARNDVRFATELRPHPARQILPVKRSRRCRALLRRSPAFRQDIAATTDFPDTRVAWRLQITDGEFREFDPCRTLRPMPMPTPSAMRMRMRAPTARPSTPRPHRSRNSWRM